MSIPDFQSIMLPLMQLAINGKEHSFRDSVEYLAKFFNLSDDERKELLPSGQQPTFDNRVGWAKTHLIKAGLLESPRRAIFQITQRGEEVISHNPAEINTKFLKQFPEYVKFAGANTSADNSSVLSQDNLTEQITPEEALASAYQKLKLALAQDLLTLVKDCTPDFFERLVVKLLVKMGYGGSIQDAGKAIGRSGDEGIDGIIKEDRLGLDAIYIQAKKWEGTVGRPEIQKFVGALAGQGAKKGVFITTSSFSKEAQEYARNMKDTKIVLLDGEQLTQYMIDYNLGVSIISQYEVKKIDSDFFADE
ncbi:restriction endonuclease [Pseudanabaena sp. Chao 1811]|uniref:restriction endonuclease n=1 Tax=Pseudanabaena sp. Chao 1811 TaxID=2963092 RepID=UPI0022F39629|nr:restriction endonuclease [Pseudanabaena sp. Chao 1811]